MLVYDAAYALGAIVASPYLVWDAIRRKRRGWKGRLGGAAPMAPSEGRRILIHAVSVGEVNAVRLLVDRLRDAGNEVVLATTTDTGFARASEAFAGKASVVRYPLDFSPCVRRFLDAVRPDAVALAELEVWPNFVHACVARGIPVGVVNGRLSRRSFRWYRLVRPVLGRAFARLAFVAAQDEGVAGRFRALGATCVTTIGTMKWDTAAIADDVPGAAELAGEMGIDRGRGLVVAGSTGPGEEALLASAVPDQAQLLCAPRKPERFGDAAAALPGCTRRTARTPARGESRFFLLDTIGELRKAYALADVVVVGRSFAPLYGSDMMEPVALGKATIVGPNVADFAVVAKALVDGGGVVQCRAEELPAVLRRLLGDVAERTRLAASGRAVIRSMQGATARNAELVLGMLGSHRG